MKVALISNRVTGETAADLASMEQLGRQAASARVDLMLFPEAAATGLVNNDDPAHDLPIGDPIPGRITDRLAALARESKAYVASGILELADNCLYDSAVLVRPDGEIALRYRRIQPQWHGRDADPDVYRQGDEVRAASTPFGRTVILICGDLFDDEIVARARHLHPDYLLLPFARNFDDGGFDQKRWDEEEQGTYAERVRKIGCTTLMTNASVDRSLAPYASFGGAMVVSAEGEVLSRRPLGEPGILLADV